MEIKDITKIFIIESPSKKDIEEGREEGKTLSQILNLAEIKNNYSNVVDINSFEDALENIAKEVKRDIKKYAAITLHFSMHGTKNGLLLTSNELIEWTAFYKLIKKFDDCLGYLPLPNDKKFAPVSLNFSVCLGYYATAIKDMGVDSPYQSLLGPTESVYWVDSLMAFAIFYHNTLHKKTSGKLAVERMNTINSFTSDVFKLDLADGLLEL